MYSIRSKNLPYNACNFIEKKLYQQFANDECDDNLLKAIEFIRNDIFHDIEDMISLTKETPQIASTQSGLPPIVKGHLVDYKDSTFLAHFAIVKSREDVDKVNTYLLSQKKIATSTHNMVAYRIDNGKDGLDEFKDDDGESGAGIRMLDLLRQLDLKNVYIMVTRWFGGTLLGPIRFKLIVKTAKDLLMEHIGTDGQIFEEDKSEHSEDHDSQEEDDDGMKKKKKKLRTITDVMNRIKWDASFDPKDFSIGYEDRFTGIEEVSWEEWEEEYGAEVPEHRIQYFKKNGEVVWDRALRKDNIFNH